MQASDGKLYGMTVGGGSSALGIIFSLDTISSTYTKLMDFDGTTNGSNPIGTLVQGTNGKLYGTTSAGGTGDAGVVFSYDLTLSTYAKIKDLDITTGVTPYGSLVQAGDGKLYGMTSGGGSRTAGVIFSVDPSIPGYTMRKDFATNGSGTNVAASLLQAGDGKLYGMTTYGGSNGVGVIFSFDPVSSIYTDLEDFDKINGANPSGSLIQGSDGKLYGMTQHGGSSNAGVIFSFDLTSFTYTKL